MSVFGCGHLQTARPLIGLCGRSPLWTSVGSPALGLCRGQPATDLVARSPRSFLSVLPGSWRLSGRPPTQGFRCGPQATDWGTHPLGHFGSGAQAAGPLIRVRAHPEFQLWAPSPLIWVPATGLQVSAGAAYPAFTVQGQRGEGRQSPWLLRRVL